ncbi:MAG: hypothetical protein M3P39_12020 [Actinomycetota bacterium]|nr:hypothetical protein [Actinomycetota bacterium]
MKRHVSLRIALLDNQIVDADRLPVGRVDDIEISVPARGERPELAALLTGAQALGERLGGGFGGALAATAARLRRPDLGGEPARIEVRHIAELTPLIELAVSLRDLPHVATLERWLADHVIGPLPGTGDARE